MRCLKDSVTKLKNKSLSEYSFFSQKYFLVVVNTKRKKKTLSFTFRCFFITLNNKLLIKIKDMHSI